MKVVLPGTFLREHMGWTSEALETIGKRDWGELEEEKAISSIPTPKYIRQVRS